MIGALLRWLSAGRVRRPSSPGFGGSRPHAPLAVCWTGAASIVFQFWWTRPACLASVCWTGAAFIVFRFRWTRPACARHAMRPPLTDGGGSRPPCPAGCLLDGCGVRCLPVWGRARHAPRPRPGVKVLLGRGTR